ncbi:Leucine-rich repeat and calponin like domain containing protein 2 [Dissostichus eleginoides]|uniref:Leucine-rich repeat and calponin like domain containing protein 2 n=1 Tax=Dissostichus eleginoides TaxID=100907 RepID=A0AAD9BIY5_DISEL|nr:Leucine-rich repeat and calponin like domain containing protein 2 [Dissostichus eleginoides]
MASSQGGVGAVTALQSHHYSSGPPWTSGFSQHQHQQQHHTARSLDRALEDAVCSGILNLSGRKLREYPGMSHDLTDTTQAGGLLCRHGLQEPTSQCAS